MIRASGEKQKDGSNGLPTYIKDEKNACRASYNDPILNPLWSLRH
jgi:hypothetical protein